MDPFWERILSLCAVFLLPLVPAIISYWLFDVKHMAKLRDVSRGITLGGPIAAYVIFLGLSHHYFSNIYTQKMQESFQEIRELDQAVERVRGQWNFISMYTDPESNKELMTKGFCAFSKKKLYLITQGNVFNNDNTVGRSFNAEPVWITGHKLTYIFEAPIRPGGSMLGIAKLTIDEPANGDLVRSMGGSHMGTDRSTSIGPGLL